MRPIEHVRMSSFPPPARPSTTSSATRLALDDLGRLIEFPRTRELLSPELALVDADLAASARARLHDPGAFYPATSTANARARSTTPAVPLPSTSAPTLAPVEPPAAGQARVATPPAPPAWPQNVVRLGLATVGLFVAATVASGALSSSGTEDAGATRASPAPAPLLGTPLRSGSASTPPRAAAPAPKQPQTQRVAARQPARTFAWAPVQGARAYEVQIFRGARLVLLSRTRQPRLTLRPAWRYAGAAFAITPGAYRWYVWPVDAAGTRARKPVVQAKLKIAPLR